jgi:outer membrane protein assembly factor BamE (lipoprotein component of BamABCDE complex)
VVLLVLSCSGCIVVPIPTREHQREDLPGRTNITPQAIEALRAGETTRQEVLQRLGNPDGVFDRERTFVYLWSNCAGYLFWAAGSESRAAADVVVIGKGYALIIDFDEDGRLLRQQTLSKNNWANWSGPRIDGTGFPQAIRNPTSLPSQ